MALHKVRDHSRCAHFYENHSFQVSTGKQGLCGHWGGSGDPAEGGEAGEGFTSLSLVYHCLDLEARLEYLMPLEMLQSPSKHFSPP